MLSLAGDLVATPASRKLSLLPIVTLLAALIGALMVVGAGPAYRLRLLGLGRAFAVIEWGAWLGLAALVLSAVLASFQRRASTRRWPAIILIAAIVGSLTFAIPYAMLRSAKRAPAIHDISTDTANPPRFVAVVPLRAGAPNSVEYAGEVTASRQHAAYPDIQPMTLGAPPEQAYRRALDVARSMGWQIDASVPAEGRIEATDTTRWFGFKDDIVIRVSPAGTGSRIDVRSESRLGAGDLGKNARRIRAYLRKLES
jgi:uncharacterized protein (DUF1499 family)